MDEPRKADPAIYPKLRERALQIRVSNLGDGSVHAILMDWNVSNGTITALAGADGTASLYLSSGGGFIGGGQKYPAIREAAFQAIRIANELLPFFQKTETFELPTHGNVYFYLITNAGVYRATAVEENLKAGTDPFRQLGAAMQQVITEYRLMGTKQPSSN